MAKIICAFMVALGAISTAAQAQDFFWRRPPPSRAPEPLTLIGLGAGLTGLYVAKRRFFKK
jgi:hypothetical protein